EIEDQAESLRQRLARAMRYRLLIARQNLTEVAQHGTFARMMDGINQRQQRLDDLRFRVEKAQRKLLEQNRRRWEHASAAVRHYDARRVLAGLQRDLASKTASLASTMRTALIRQRGRLEQIESGLRALSPVAILERGYALVFDSKGQLLKDSAHVQTGDAISARLAKGTFSARVEAKD
ncbi:MAG TPA: exodeoxyribonuclease VII large subunit, partial [Terriglobales bacterium]|nr:exodeoxyribonuclease VII large subunit [Terriglobales bacterium]